MAIKVGINGFGRFSRIIFRTCIQNPDINITAINDPAIDSEYICYLIKFDSTHGKFNGCVTHINGEIKINNEHVVKIFHEKLPSSVPWQSAGVEYVIEASGKFTNLEKASGHLASDSVKRVFVTAPSVDTPILILGVNEDQIQCEEQVISCASSTLYCLAPIIKVLEANYGVIEGLVTNIHAMTPSLKPLDGLCLRGKQWRDHRSIHQNIIPAATTACKALGRILPQVKDKLTGLAFRVPIVNVSVLDISIRLNTNTTLQDIVTKVEKAGSSSMENIIKLSIDEAVSSDFVGDSHSCILDVNMSLQLRPNFYKLVCWYENEYSYACRVIESIFFTEKQMCLPNPRRTTIYFRQRRSKKQDKIQQTEDSTKMLIECNYNSANEEIIGFENLQLITNSKHRNIISRKALLNTPVDFPKLKAGDTKTRNEVFRIRNDDNEMNKYRKKTSCFRNYDKMYPQVKSIDRIVAVRKIPKEMSIVSEHLENVEEEYSKKSDNNITEDLLKKSYSHNHNFPMKVSNNTNITCGSKINDDETNKVKYISTLESGIPQNTKTNVMFKVSGDCKFIKSINVDIKEQKSSYSSDEKEYSYYDINKKERSSKVIQPLKTVNIDHIDNKETFQCSQNNATKCEKSEMHLKSKINFDFKEQVAKTINSLIDGIMQRMQIQFGLFPNEKPKLRKRKRTKSKKEIINNIVNSNAKSNNHSEYFFHVKKDFSEIKVPDILKEHLRRPENIKNRITSKNYDTSDNNILVPINNDIKSDSNKSVILNKKTIQDLNKLTLGSVEINSNNTTRCVSPENTITTTNNYDSYRYKQDIYDKLDSTSATDSENSFYINERKSQVIHIRDLTNSIEDLDHLDKICKIIEISDELSDMLFSGLDNNDDTNIKKQDWSLKDLCERIKLDEFCNKLFGKP